MLRNSVLRNAVLRKSVRGGSQALLKAAVEHAHTLCGGQRTALGTGFADFAQLAVGGARGAPREQRESQPRHHEEEDEPTDPPPSLFTLSAHVIERRERPCGIYVDGDLSGGGGTAANERRCRVSRARQRIHPSIVATLRRRRKRRVRLSAC